MKISFNKINIFLIWIFPLVAYQFFQYTGFNKNAVIFSSVLFIAVIIFYVSDYIFLKTYKNKVLKIYQLFIYWLFFCTLISPILIWSQGIFLNFRISIEIYRYIYIFLLLKTAITEKKLVTLIDTYLIINLILKFIFIKYSLVGVFGFEGDFGDNDVRGILRPRFEGSEFAALAFFLHIGKYKNKNNRIDLIFILLAFIAILLDLARQYIFFSAILGVIMFIKSSRYKIAYITIIGIMLYFLPDFLMKTQLPIIKDLVELSQDQFESNKNDEKDIRIVETEYFLKDFNHSLSQVIIGNGLPHANSSYGKKIVKLSENDNLYSNDVGYVHIFLYSGIIGLFMYVLVYFNLLRESVQEKYLWTKFFLVYIILTNIASQTMSISGITISIAIYFIIAFGRTKKKQITNENIKIY